MKKEKEMIKAVFHQLSLTLGNTSFRHVERLHVGQKLSKTCRCIIRKFYFYEFKREIFNSPLWTLVSRS